MSVENEQLKSAQKETAGANTEMTKQFLAAKQEIASLKNQVAFLSRENVRLTDIINQHANALYGRKSEKVEDIFCVDTGQEEICDPLDEDAEEPEEELTSSDLYKTRKQLLRSGERCHGKKTPGKRENDLSKLPVKITYDCDVDGINEQYGEGTWGIIFWERHDRIEIIPCTTFRHSIYTPVIKHIEEGYLQRMPNHYEFRPRSLVSSSLLSLIIKDKYSLFLPTYRQEHDECRFGIQISRQTMTNWILWTSELVWPV